MPDIRTTGIIDTFNYVENPISNGGRWIKWMTANVRATGSLFHPAGAGDSLYYWNPIIHNGDAEVWGITNGQADVSEGWRIGFARAGGQFGGGVAYQLLIWNSVGSGGSDSWTLRKYAGGGYVKIGSILGPQGSSGQYILIRRVGTALQCWHGGLDGSNWTLILQVTDNTYTTNMHPALGMASDDGTQESWQAIGGAIVHRTQDIAIKRFIPTTT